MRNLYTYVPEENTVSTEGILSTKLARKGWEKYKERSGMRTKKQILRWLDLLDPDFRRSEAITVLTDPVPGDAHPDFVEFANRKKLYKLPSYKELKDLGVVSALRSINVGGKGTHKVKDTMKSHIAWDSKKPGKFLFSNVPHYLLSTTRGRIPSELVEEVLDITFPEDEKDKLITRDSIVTTRVSNDYTKFNLGDLVKSPWGKIFRVVQRKDVGSIEDHPYKDQLTNDQKKLLSSYDKQAVLWLDSKSV